MMPAAQSLFHNILAGGRLVFFLRARPDVLRISLDQLVILLVLGIALQFGVMFLLTEPPRAFNVGSIPNWGFASFAMLFAAYLVARFMGASERATQLLVILSAASLWTNPIAHLIFALAGEDITPASILIMQMTFGIVLVWGLAVTVRAIRMVWPAKTGRALLGVVLLYGVTLGTAYGFPPAPPWYTSRGDVADARPDRFKRIPIEETYRAQGELLAHVAESLAPQRAGVTDLYFLGFGGYADQDVFMREVISVRDLFDQRFDTQDRSLALINNRATLETTPIASLTNLEESLAIIGERIDPEEDVVFVYLTSHGSADHRLSADFWPLGLTDITPGKLKGALDQAEVKWRVIVVSACYSGGFIEALKDEHSLIITAARPDRKSFGCSNEAEFTYFGKAYFDQELRREVSFIEAFSRARAAVEQRELAEDRAPSEPQRYIGAKIEAKLAQLEERLRRRQSAASVQ